MTLMEKIEDWVRELWYKHNTETDPFDREFKLNRLIHLMYVVRKYTVILMYFCIIAYAISIMAPRVRRSHERYVSGVALLFGEDECPVMKRRASRNK